MQYHIFSFWVLSLFEFLRCFNLSFWGMSQFDWLCFDFLFVNKDFVKKKKIVNFFVKKVFLWKFLYWWKESLSLGRFQGHKPLGFWPWNFLRTTFTRIPPRILYILYHSRSIKPQNKLCIHLDVPISFYFQYKWPIKSCLFHLIPARYDHNRRFNGVFFWKLSLTKVSFKHTQNVFQDIPESPN